MKAANQTDSLILALAQLTATGRTDWTVPELIVAAFRANPKMWRMALAEPPDYPCSNRVSCCLAGKNGPIRRGYIERPIPGISIVRLTQAGKKRAKQLEDSE